MGNQKYWFGGFVIVIVTALQISAWVMGFDGAVFSFTSLIIGAVAGAVLGFSISQPKTGN